MSSPTLCVRKPLWGLVLQSWRVSIHEPFAPHMRPTLQQQDNDPMCMNGHCTICQLFWQLYSPHWHQDVACLAGLEVFRSQEFHIAWVCARAGLKRLAASLSGPKVCCS